MKDFLRLILQYLWVILPYQEKERWQYRFNLRNPLGYLLLFIVAVVVGIAEGATSFYRVIDETLSDAIRDTKSIGVYTVTETGSNDKPFVAPRNNAEQTTPLPPVNGNQLHEDAVRGRDSWPE